MTATKTLFIIKNSGEQPNLLIKTIFSIFDQKEVDPYCVIFFDTNTNLIHNQVHQKILFLIKNNFIDYINNKQLIIIQQPLEHTIPTLLKNNALNYYDLYLPIDINNIYFQHYATNIDKYLKFNQLDDIKVQAIYGIDINNNFKNYPSIINIAFTKKSLKNILIKPEQIYTTNDVLSYSLENKNIKHNVIDPDFNLVWLEEQENNTLVSSYVFVYKKQNKVFNIKNNTHGILNSISDKELKINWFVNACYKEYVYELNDTNIFINIQYE